MKLAMAQIQMSTSMEENLDKTLTYMKLAKKNGADLIFFPEIQLSPFFPKYRQRDAAQWLLSVDSPEIKAIREVCRSLRIYASPNVYLLQNDRRYDASLMIDDGGEIVGISKMVHITQAEYFYEQDYYTPSDDGFKVYQTPFGNIGIVICFDRHLPDGIRSCAVQGADLVIIPTANMIGEPLELFEWEVRVQSFQNTVFTAMCNRVGKEDALTFAGQSLLCSPDGKLLYKAGDAEELLLTDIRKDEVQKARKLRPWLTL